MQLMVLYTALFVGVLLAFDGLSNSSLVDGAARRPSTDGCACSLRGPIRRRCCAS
jgi:hypothetical protein